MTDYEITGHNLTTKFTEFSAVKIHISRELSTVSHFV